jgi:hypothetical protein
MCRESPPRAHPGNGDFQYVQDKQEVTLNDHFGVNTGHPTELLRYSPGKV